MGRKWSMGIWVNSLEVEGKEGGEGSFEGVEEEVGLEGVKSL